MGHWVCTSVVHCLWLGNCCYGLSARVLTVGVYGTAEAVRVDQPPFVVSKDGARLVFIAYRRNDKLDWR